MVPSKSASVVKKKQRKEKRLKATKAKSFKSDASTSLSDVSHSKNKKSRTENEPTGGLKLLKRHAVTMASITKRKSRKKVKRVILFNQKGVPYGKVASQMQSYLPISDEFTKIVDAAIAMFNAERQQRGRKEVLWKSLDGIPEQPDNKQCGFFVMRLMRDIIENKDLTLFPKVWDKEENYYSTADIDVVRSEWAKFVVKMCP